MVALSEVVLVSVLAVTVTRWGMRKLPLLKLSAADSPMALLVVCGVTVTAAPGSVFNHTS